MQPFRPPLPSPALIRFVQGVAPWALRVVLKVAELDFPHADAERLRELCTAPLIVAPNHPTLDDPAVVFAAGARAELSFHYMCATDTFDAAGPVGGALLQRIGAFSVERGALDRPAFACTRQLLTDGASVVIFPEGETYGLNDELLPFQDGVVQLGFWAAQDRVKSDADGPVRLLPVALRYRFIEDMCPEIERSLDRLEGALRLPASRDSYLSRLLRIAHVVVRQAESEMRLTATGDLSLDERIERLRDQLVHRAACNLGMSVPSGSRQDQARMLYAKTQELMVANAAPLEQIEAALADLRRLHYYNAVRAGYVSERPTAERMMEVIARVELDVLGRTRRRGPRRGIVRLGEPFDLTAMLPVYRQTKRETVEQVTGQLRDRVESLLQATGGSAIMLPAERWRGAAHEPNSG